MDGTVSLASGPGAPPPPFAPRHGLLSSSTPRRRLAVALPRAPAGALAAGRLRPGTAPCQRHPRAAHGPRALALLPPRCCLQGTSDRETGRVRAADPGPPECRPVVPPPRGAPRPPHSSPAEPGAGTP